MEKEAKEEVARQKKLDAEERTRTKLERLAADRLEKERIKAAKIQRQKEVELQKTLAKEAKERLKAEKLAARCQSQRNQEKVKISLMFQVKLSTKPTEIQSSLLWSIVWLPLPHLQTCEGMLQILFLVMVLVQFQILTTITRPLYKINFCRGSS